MSKPFSLARDSDHSSSVRPPASDERQKKFPPMVREAVPSTSRLGEAVLLEPWTACVLEFVVTMSCFGCNFFSGKSRL